MLTPKEIRAAGETLGREGLAKRAIEIMEEAVKDGSYKKAIEAAGRLSVIAQASEYDGYWKEKKDSGRHSEIYHIENASAAKFANG